MTYSAPGDAARRTTRLVAPLSPLRRWRNSSSPSQTGSLAAVSSTSSSDCPDAMSKTRICDVFLRSLNEYVDTCAAGQRSTAPSMSNTTKRSQRYTSQYTMQSQHNNATSTAYRVQREGPRRIGHRRRPTGRRQHHLGGELGRRDGHVGPASESRCNWGQS